MQRHLPPKPEPRYWVTGNYIFDYRDSKFGIGAMLQAFLVGDPVSDLPLVAYFQFDTEALGKFTGQLAVRFCLLYIQQFFNIFLFILNNPYICFPLIAFIHSFDVVVYQSARFARWFVQGLPESKWRPTQKHQNR